MKISGGKQHPQPGVSLPASRGASNKADHGETAPEPGLLFQSLSPLTAKKARFDQIRNPGRIVPVEAGDLGGERPIDREGDQVVLRPAEAFPSKVGPEDLDLRVGIPLVPLRKDDIRIPDVTLADLGKPVIGIDILDDRDLMGRNEDRGHSACLPVAPTVLALVIDLEAVAVVLDGRHPPPPAGQFGYELFDQRGLARFGFSDNGNDGDHGGILADRKRIGHRFFTGNGGSDTLIRHPV
jgi:hypothetical protein